MRLLILVFTLFFTAGPASAAVSAASALPPPKTVWDRLMRQQGALSVRNGYSLMLSGDYVSAAKEFFRAVTLDPKDPAARMGYGSALYWLGEYGKAMQEFNNAVLLAPDKAAAYQLRAITAARGGRFGDALADFLKAVKLEPENGEIRMNTGSVYYSLGNFPEALDNFRLAVKYSPRNPLFHYQLGLFYYRTGREEEALAELKKALSVYPYYEDAAFSAGVVSEALGDTASALKYYKKAVGLKPRDSAARFRLALALGKLGRSSDIGAYIADAFRIAPVNDRGGMSLAMAYSSRKEVPAGPQTRDGNEPAAARDGSAGALEKALDRIPSDHDIIVSVEILEIPKSSIVAGSAGSSGTEGRLAAAMRRSKLDYTKKEYKLFAEDEASRKKKNAAIISEVKKIAAAVPEDCDSRFSFTVETAPGGGASGGTGSKEENEKKAAAQYIPRDVGNDMGLWISGDSWLSDIADSVDEMRGSAPAWENFRLVRGLGYLLLGETSEALEDFDGDSVYGLLGRSAAYTAAGDTDKALAECIKVLKIDGDNKVAMANRTWLEMKEGKTSAGAEHK